MVALIVGNPHIGLYSFWPHFLNNGVLESWGWVLGSKDEGFGFRF